MQISPLIPISQRGCILSGENKGWFIKVEKDSGGTNGYYVFISSNPDFRGEIGEGFDDWVPNLKSVEDYFDDPELQVKWD